ncbi:MAG: glycosyltransferase [Akkermansia sp.]|nr:glycosyltransferase [Akkermansia sp.]
MNNTVHQIWLGNDLPEREAEWIHQVKTHAARAGWNHRLWRDEDIRRAWGGSEVYLFFTHAREVLDNAVTLTLMSDYFRLLILATHGGLYLDTDFSCTAWPDLPQDGDVWSAAEVFNSQKPCNCAILALNPAALSTAAQMAADKLLALKPNAPGFPFRYINLVRRDTGGLPNGIGPHWIRQSVIPALERAGLAWHIFPTTITGHVRWKAESPLTHHGVSWWHEGPRAKQAGIWQERAKAALSKTAAAIHAPKPLGRAILPGPPAARQATYAERAPMPFPLPNGTRRVVVLANTPFNAAEVLRGGDLVLHLNRARHAAEAMAVAGTTHILLVRHGGKGRDIHWFTPPSFGGYQRVIFIDDALHTRPFSWYAQFKNRGGKSPTTGFIAANMMRACWPQLPLVLAGFDPERKHGTPMWKGHSWGLEAQIYAEQSFHTIHPTG